jgi:thiol-disulfide isomerase/thioredoxin
VTGLHAAGSPDDRSVVVYFFHGEGCPACAQEKPFLEELQRRYADVEVRDYEVWYDEDNQALLKEMAAKLGFEPRGVPVTIIGDRVWVGFSDPIAREMEAEVVGCREVGCVDAGAGVIPGVTAEPKVAVPSRDERADSTVLQLPLVGAVDLGARSLVVSTALIGFMDGFNPCSLWVLSVLIALTLRIGSRRKIFIIGITFITVTALIYVLFIAGLFTVLTFVSFLGWIQAVMALLALFFALVSIKDYFWYKQGVSFTIADEKKPGIYRKMRRILNATDSLPAMIGATVVLAVSVSLVEFSCTAGLPVLWTNLLTAQDVEPTTFALLLALYMIIYQLDELAIFSAAVFTLKASRLEEKHGRVLKLFGGVLMLTLAAAMLIDPALMNRVSSSLLVFGAAIGLALLVLLVHRVILPRFGIVIGSEVTEDQGEAKR